MSENLTNIKAEKHLVSACLNGRILEVLAHCKADDFSNPSNKLIFEVSNKLYQKDILVTEANVTDALKKAGKFGTETGQVSFTYLENIANIAAKDIDANAELVHKLGNRRRLSELYKQEAARLDAGSIDADESVAEVVNNSYQFSSNINRESLHISEVDDKLDKHFQALRDGNILSFRLGYPKTDKALGGVRLTDMIGILSAPGQAKSLLCTRALMELAFQGLPGVKYSLEMKDEQEELRMISMLSNNLPLSDIKGDQGSKELTPDQWQELHEIRQKVRSLPLHMDYMKHDLFSILEDAEKRISTTGAKVIAVDYAQKIYIPNMNNEISAINTISGRFRDLALRKDVIVILVIRMDKAGAKASLSGESITGAEGYGASSLLSDVSGMLHTRLNKPFVVCDCKYDINIESPFEISTHHNLYLDKKSGNRMSKHTTTQALICGDCGEKLRNDKNRMGFIDLLKSRDGETADRIPAILIGPTVKFMEMEDTVL